MGLFVPIRRRGYEILDDPAVEPATRLRSMTDVARSNRLFGGRRAAIAAVEATIGRTTDHLSVLDVGTGLADIPGEILRRSDLRGGRVTTIGLDDAIHVLPDAKRRLHHAVCGSVRSLPFRDGSVDVVICSQLLHHFADEDLSGVIAELDRVARHRVVIADLRRSWVAAAGFWLASVPLGFHAVTRHDGVVSVLRGFTAVELRDAVRRSVGADPIIERHLGFRLTVSWTPDRAA